MQNFDDIRFIKVSRYTKVKGGMKKDAILTFVWRNEKPIFAIETTKGGDINKLVVPAWDDDNAIFKFDTETHRAIYAFTYAKNAQGQAKAVMLFEERELKRVNGQLMMKKDGIRKLDVVEPMRVDEYEDPDIMKSLLTATFKAYERTTLTATAQA